MKKWKLNDKDMQAAKEMKLDGKSLMEISKCLCVYRKPIEEYLLNENLIDVTKCKYFGQTQSTHNSAKSKV